MVSLIKEIGEYSRGWILKYYSVAVIGILCKEEATSGYAEWREKK